MDDSTELISMLSKSIADESVIKSTYRIEDLQSVTKLLSHPRKNEIFVPPFPNVNAVLKKVPDRDETHDFGSFLWYCNID